MTKVLPKDLTSYDFLKTVAVILMLVDHVGFYFFPENLWWRVFGRMCVPIWFFLIGYAQSRDLSPRLWIGAALLIAGNFIAGMSIVPLNILATMIIIRIIIDPIMNHALQNRSAFWAIAVMMMFLIIPSGVVSEYGTQAIIMAIFGYLVRHRDKLEEPQKFITQYMVFAMVSFVVFQFFVFLFEEPQFITLCIGIFIVMGTLFFFRSLTFPKLTQVMPRPFTWFFQIMGRRTLEIYVFHLLLFKGMALFYEPERFVLLDWKWFSPTGV